MKLDVDTELQVCTIKSEKMATEVIVQKRPRDHHFFEVKFTTGSVPEELSGRYSSLDVGIKAVGDYLRSRRATSAVRRDTFAKERKQRNASKNRTEGSKHIRKGSGN